MHIQFIGYPSCSTSRKAEKYLKDHHIPYDFRHIVEDTPSALELSNWLAKSGYPISKLLNTSGKVYQALQLKDRIKTMSDEELISLLASDGMLLKRPMLISDTSMLTGFREDQYDAFFSDLDFV